MILLFPEHETEAVRDLTFHDPRLRTVLLFVNCGCEMGYLLCSYFIILQQTNGKSMNFMSGNISYPSDPNNVTHAGLGGRS